MISNQAKSARATRRGHGPNQATWRPRGRAWLAGVIALVSTGLPIRAQAPNAGQEAPANSDPILIAPQSRNVTILPHPHPHPWPRPEHWVRPTVRVERADVSVEIHAQVATTTLVFALRNDSPAALETQILVPVPASAAVRGFQLDSVGNEPTATLLPIDEARAIYQSIVSKAKDPGLLEFVGTNLIRSSVFPVPAHGTNTVRLTYEELLTPDGDRLDYTLLRSDSLGTEGGTWRGGERLLTQWSYSVDVKADRAIASVTSPSHEIDITRPETVTHQRVLVKSRPGAAATPGAFRLSVLLAKGEQPTGTLVLYPDASVGPNGGGYFMLLVSPNPGQKPADAKVLSREITLVIDRSGSMQGVKMEQAKAAALYVVEGLREGERFNIIDYSDSVQSLFPEPKPRDAETIKQARAYIAAIQANGGTNIHDAMIEALRPKVQAELPLVLFLTDGLPTVGQTSESQIRLAIEKANEVGAAQGRAKRRIFTFGVGVDVNVPLLSNIATASRAASTFVLPEENVEVKVSQVSRRLTGPVIAGPELAGAGVRELQPTILPDVFDGDQLVVLGQYTGSQPGSMTLTGQFGTERRELAFSIDPSRARVQHAYVSRLWARSKIGYLIDQIRKSGETGMSAGDPKNKELIDEIVRLSTKFGILSEYTAFLAIEPAAVGLRAGSGAHERLMREFAIAPPAPARAAESLRKAVDDRAGNSAVAQGRNLQAMGVKPSPSDSAIGFDPTNQSFINEKMERVDITGVQFVGDLALFARPGRWVESSLLADDQDKLDPQQTIEFASEAYMNLAAELATTHRAGMLALGQDVYFLHNNQRVLVKGQPEEITDKAEEPK
jgi:Ca-activated chloride channel homolog